MCKVAKLINYTSLRKSLCHRRMDWKDILDIYSAKKITLSVNLFIV